MYFSKVFSTSTFLDYSAFHLFSKCHTVIAKHLWHFMIILFQSFRETMFLCPPSTAIHCSMYHLCLWRCKQTNDQVHLSVSTFHYINKFAMNWMLFLKLDNFFSAFLKRVSSMYRPKSRKAQKRLKDAPKRMSNFMSSKFGLYLNPNQSCHFKLKMHLARSPRTMKRVLISKLTKTLA